MTTGDEPTAPAEEGGVEQQASTGEQAASPESQASAGEQPASGGEQPGSGGEQPGSGGEQPAGQPSAPARRPSTWAEWWEWPYVGSFADWLRSMRGGAEPMRLEEFTEGDQHVVRADLPGVDPDKDVEITISRGSLHLRAERRESSRSQTASGFRSEVRYGLLERTIPLPAGVDENQVHASYADGVLEIRMPLGGESTARKVEIQRP